MFEVVFENADVIAADKAPGTLTVPSRFENEDDRLVLGRELEKHTGGRLFPVHRLDFEVGGLVLFAKNATAHRALGEWFEKRKVEKTYQGISATRDFSHWPENLPRQDREIPLQQWQEWKCRLLRGKRRSYEHAKGDPAETLARWEAAEDNRSFWTLRPKTGRAHQLRFEMSRHGFSLLGDVLYGAKEQWQDPVLKCDGIALRAVALDLSLISSSERFGLPERLSCRNLFSCQN